MKRTIKSIFISLALASAAIVAPAHAQNDNELCDMAVKMFWHQEEQSGTADSTELSEWAYDNVKGYPALDGPTQMTVAWTTEQLYANNPKLRDDVNIDRSYQNIHKACVKALK